MPQNCAVFEEVNHVWKESEKISQKNIAHANEFRKNHYFDDQKENVRADKGNKDHTITGWVIKSYDVFVISWYPWFLEHMHACDTEKKIQEFFILLERTLCMN